MIGGLLILEITLLERPQAPPMPRLTQVKAARTMTTKEDGVKSVYSIANSRSEEGSQVRL